MNINLKYFKEGLKDGVPIALGYLAVSFSLGIAASNAGLTALQGYLASFLCKASAGEAAGFTAIKEQVPYLEIIIVTFVANCRYLLMSFALSQRLNPKMNIIHRFLLGFYLTDEFFALSISQDGYVNPYKCYGAAIIGSPCWCIGTSLGIIAGNILPAKIVAALSVALYGMFLSVIIPKAKEDRYVFLSIIGAFFMSFILSFTGISSGIRVIIVTVLIASTFAVIKPRSTEDE